MIRGQAWPRRVLAAGFIIAFLLPAGTITRAEDGYRLWLRYDPLPGSWIEAYRPRVASVVVPGSSATLNAIRAELSDGCTGLFGSPVAAGIVDRDGAVIVGTPQSSPLIASLKWPLAELGPEGFRIRSVRLNGRAVTVIAANSEVGVLYGAFHFLRLIQTARRRGEASEYAR
jgi:alpha-glucuronidase